MTVIGKLDFRSWDDGCYQTFGGRLVEYPVDGSVRTNYVADIVGINSQLDRFENAIPMFFDSPEDPFQDFILPSIVFKQNDESTAFERQPWYSVAARGPAKDAEEIKDDNGEVIGHTKYDTQLRGEPLDFTYDVTIYARRKQELNIMRLWAAKIMKRPWFVFKVIDSLGDVREYDAGEVSASNTSELADIAERTASVTKSFTVRGEVDIYDDIEAVAMTDPRSSVVGKEV